MIYVKIKCSEIKVSVPASQLEADLLAAFSFVKTTFFMSVGVQMFGPPPVQWRLKLLLASVKKSTLHISITRIGVATLLVESYVFGCTFQCDFVAVQFFAEKGKS